MRERLAKLGDPEYFGTRLHDRPGWLDEVTAILLIVFGMMSLLALLSTSPAAALSTQWSNVMGEVFGHAGAIILSIMIIAAGVLIVLPKIGVVIYMPWRRVIVIEIAYFALLGFLHLVAHDPEPRALARSGQGGGYIGWAISEPVFKLFGSGLSLFFFASIVVIALGTVIGIKRRQVQKGLVDSAKWFENVAERMKREPAPKPTPAPDKPMARPLNAEAARPLDSTSTPALTASLPAEPASPPRKSIPMARPLARTSEPAEPVKPSTPSRKSIPVPTVVPAAHIRPEFADENPAAAPRSVPSAMATEPPILPPTPTAPPAGQKSKPTPKSVPVQPERRTRHFTVEDFKEVRQPIARSGELPPMTLLSDVELNKPTEQEINGNVQIIENTLLEFDIDVEVVDVKIGPTVTQYAVQPFRETTNDQGEIVLQRVRVNKIASLSGDLALALSARRLRIQPYVPGHPYMGIEVPNRTPSTVALRPVMESENFAKTYRKRDAETGQSYEVPLAVPLGRDVSGSAFAVDLASMPHLLIAGTTGSGKSVCITAIAVSLILNNMPDRLKLVMLDPKMVELGRFNGLPHLLGPVETDMERIIGVLRWATREMDRRYKLLEAEAARNLDSYNKATANRPDAERLPYIVILIDEIGDLMLSRPDEMERTLTRLAQMARAVGIHLVVATQRPSVDIITGLIKANFPARISFAVASGVDSRVILDTTGAETLMGRGDMLYLAPDASGPQRLQGCFVSDDEIDSIVNYWKDWQAKHPDAKATAAEAPWEQAMTRRESLNESEPLLEDAIDLVVREGEASASLIQRRLGIGYPRAAQILDMLTELGVIGKAKDGGRSREVLMKPGMDSYKKLMGKYRK